jgi:TRAP-type C4-dicarboxylate transport system permease small subunit
MRIARVIVEALSGLLLGAIVVIILVQVIARYVLEVAISWPEESARYALVWLTFIGAAAAAARASEITVDSLTEMAPRAVRRGLHLLAAVGGLVAFGFLIWASLPLFGFPARTLSPATRISMGWVYLALPVGAALAMLFLAARLVRPVIRDSEAAEAAGGRPAAGPQA